MQYLLTEEEYSELKRNEVILERLYNYIAIKSEVEHYTDYAYKGKTRVMSFNGTKTVINIEPYKLLKILDIHHGKNIEVNLISD